MDHHQSVDQGLGCLPHFGNTSFDALKYFKSLHFQLFACPCIYDGILFLCVCVCFEALIITKQLEKIAL